MQGLVQDLRFTLRHMAKHPGLATVVILSLALGIGANTAIFSLIRGVILRDLPVREPDRLVLLYWGANVWPEGLVQSGSGVPRQTPWRTASRSLPYPFFRHIERDGTLFESVFAFAPLGISRQNVTLAAEGSGERVDGEMVSGGYFGGLGVRPAAGRLISPADDETHARVAVLSHAYWMRRFAGDPAIVGGSITINGLPFSLIGVAHEGFTGVQPGRIPDVFIVMTDAPEFGAWGYRPSGSSPFAGRDYWWVQVMGRLAEGVETPQTEATLDAAFQGFVADALPRVDRDNPPHIELEAGGGGLDIARGRYERPLYVLMGLVCVVLLIACANVAVLLLAAAMARRREFALRLSLGARRGRLVRQLLTESLFVASAGGLLGLLCAGWTARGLLYLLPPNERPLIPDQIDPGVLLFAAAISVATALAFGIVPALVGTRVDLLPALRESSGTVADQPSRRAWSSALVVVQVALSLVLLVTAALFLRTINSLYAQPLGLETGRILVFGVDASQSGYAGERLAAVYAELIQQLEALPGARAVTAARLRLFSGWRSSSPISIPGSSPKADMLLFSNGVGPGFARALGLRVLAGRDLSWDDIHGERRVALVNETMATYFFGGGNPLGRRFTYGSAADADGGYEIVGVVSNAKYTGVRGDFPKTAYLPYTANRAALGELHLMIRTDGDPLALAPAAREAVRRVDSTISIVSLDRMDGHVEDSLWRERLFARLTSAFGVLALALACVGLHGTIAYGVGRRRAEIAVRLALGATRGQILWMVLRGALRLGAAGVAVGLPLAVWAGRLLASQVEDVTAGDPAAFAAGAAVLGVVALLAAYIPARRATLIEPAAALKQS